jgi:hypothetical protein
MKDKHLIILTGIIIVLALMSFSALVMEQYCKHQAVVHHSAFYEANSWGVVSFHWNDNSYAHTPLQDPDLIAYKMEQAFQAKLKTLDIK